MKRTATLSLAILAIVGAILIDPANTVEQQVPLEGTGVAGATAPFDSSGTVLAVGDIADCEGTGVWNRIVSVFDGRLAWAGVKRQQPVGTVETAKLIEEQPGIVLALGDLAYPDGEYEDFVECFAPLWKSLLSRTYPVPGNHEYKSDAVGYRAFWGARVGSKTGLYYSFDYAGWHLVGLSSEIDAGPQSEQAAWLEADLSAHAGACILAFDHRPAFSADKRFGDENARRLFEILDRHGASILLSGHNHMYERTAPLTGQGEISGGKGIRQFVVGTGGHKLEGRQIERAFFTEALVAGHWGALRIDLSSDGYAWRFIEAPSSDVLDSGKEPCVRG